MDTIENPLGNAVELAPRPGALVSVEQQRAIAEVQARMLIARANPRDPIRCMDLILQDCTRPTLAESAIYQYARGGTDIAGPSIRLAETIARRWGNIASGIKEISRQQGYSECVAYAWDLETGYYDERQFQVRHWRDTKGGGYQIRDERDIYELIANMGQRRKRAVLLSVIPGDVTEAAVEQCEATLNANADTSPEAIMKMVAAFGSYGVTKEQIETRCQRHIDAIRPAQLVQLRKIYASLKDGMSGPEDWFSPIAGAVEPTARGTAALRERMAAQQAPQADALDQQREIAEAQAFAAGGEPKRRRRTKAEMEAARAAEVDRQSVDEDQEQNPQDDDPAAHSRDQSDPPDVGPESASSNPDSPADPLPDYRIDVPLDRETGKPLWQAWWAVLFTNRLGQSKTREEFTLRVAANADLRDIYYETLTPMGKVTAMKELDDIAAALPV